MVSSQVFESDISFAFVLITGNIKKVKMHKDKKIRTALDEETQKALAAAESRANGTPVNLEGMVLWDKKYLLSILTS